MNVRAAILAGALLVPGVAASAEPPLNKAGEALYERWPSIRVSSPTPSTFRHAELEKALEALAAKYPGLFETVTTATSNEGRKIRLLRAGTGPRKVLLWTQMHGDEPTGTSAILDLLSDLGVRSGEPDTKELLSSLTLYVIPMLNPDGSERFVRWNAQGIDINRDALALASPEARFLKSVRDAHEPYVGYNLHNQFNRVTAGGTGGPVSLAVLSVPFDEAFTASPGRTLTKRLAVAIQDLLAPYTKDTFARYKTDYTARAFGDSMTRWGTPTLLIEAGFLPGPGAEEQLVRLYWVARRGSLQLLARGQGRLGSVKEARYDAIPLNTEGRLYDVILRDLMVVNGRGLAPYPASIALLRGNRRVDGDGRGGAYVREVGDLAEFATPEPSPAVSGLYAAPAPGGDAEGWPAVLDGLAARGLVTEEGALRLKAEDLTKEVAAWAGKSILEPGYGGDLLLFRTTREGGLVLDAFVRKGKLETAPRR
ncbi:MAG: peptidase M14 [Acidobacteria bacterium]|nr:peptidase M14 [Acidobacteriota bacterium]